MTLRPPSPRFTGMAACLTIWMLLIPSLSPAQSEKESARALSRAFRDAVHKVRPAVVSISAEKKAEPVKAEDYENIPEIFKRFIPKENFEEQLNPKRSWQGSGMIISPSGEVLTNFHVVNDADKLSVTLDDGNECEAKVLASDQSTDIALVQLIGEAPFAYCTLGDSDAMDVGDWVLAIGNPFGLSQSVS